MPDEKTIERARKDRRAGKAPSTQAGEFVREEIEHVRRGKHGAASTRQAIAIGLSKARRAGVKLPPPAEGRAPEGVRRRAARDLELAGTRRRRSRKRAQAATRALRRRGRSAASTAALSKQAKASAQRRGTASRKAAAEKAVRTKGPRGRSAAARKAARTRARRSKGLRRRV